MGSSRTPFLEQRQLRHLLGHLHGEFARRQEDQTLRRRAVRPCIFFDERDGEGRRLARTGLRLADHVLAREQDGDRRRLHRRGFLETEPRDGLEDFRRQAEFGERLLFHGAFMYARKGLGSSGIGRRGWFFLAGLKLPVGPVR